MAVSAFHSLVLPVRLIEHVDVLAHLMIMRLVET
jgi:hypothetical protein